MSTTYTPNYNLGKQEDHADKFDMSVITENMDKLDTVLHEQAEDISEAQNRQDSLDTAEAADRAALAELIDGAAKNRLPFKDISMIKQMNTGGTWDGNVYTNRGVTFTVNDDFSVTVSGTATGGNGVLVLSPRGGFSIEEGEWVLSGCPSGGSTATYNISIANTTSDTGRAAEFTSVSAKLVRIYILDGTTVDDLVFRPMVCSKAAWDISQTFEPYRPSYAELYAMVQALQGGSNSISSVQSTAQLTSIDAGDNDADS
ncbi:MAG: hypothetical protein IJK30_11230 [Ruminococcus sp.]|nr:hypothetical protein [Ruminococcus sp.]